jgi:hypothetical protein
MELQVVRADDMSSSVHPRVPRMLCLLRYDLDRAVPVALFPLSVELIDECVAMPLG